MGERPEAMALPSPVAGAIVPNGESSVMPQLVCTRAWKRCSMRWIRISGEAVTITTREVWPRHLWRT